MQYSHVFNPQANNSSLNASKPAVTNLPKGQAPADNAGKGSINNIFSRNVTSNPLSNTPPPNQILAGVSKPNSYGALSLDFSLPPANNSFAANANRIGGASNTYMNPFNNLPIKSFNIFEANNSQQGVGFSSNTTQNNKSNINIFTNNSNTSTTNSFPHIFNATQPPTKFAPALTNTLSPTTNSFSSQNVYKPLNSNSPNSQGNSAYNQIFDKNSASPIKNAFGNVSPSSNTTQPLGTSSQTNASNPFFNRPISSNNHASTIIQNQNQNQAQNPFQAPNSFHAQNIFQTQNSNQYQTQHTNPLQNQNPFNNQAPQQQPNLQDQNNSQAAPQLQLQRLMKGMNLGDFKAWNSPYNLYHTNLMVYYLLENLNKNTSQRQYMIPNQFYCTFVKDSPFKHHILVKLSEIVKIKQNLKKQKQNLIKMDKQTDELIQLLVNKVAAAKMCKIKKIKLEETMKSIQWELKIIRGQVYNFMQPLLNACLQNRRFTFQDPDDFDIEIAKIIQQKMTIIQSSIKKVAAESIEAYNVITTLEEQHGAASKLKVIHLLNDFQALCMKFESMKDQFEGLKPYLPLSATTQTDTGNQPSQEVTAASLIKPILSKRAQKIDQALFNKE